MAYRCDLCKKGKLVGRSHRHHRGVAGGQWKQKAPKTIKVSKPNLHSFNGVLNGKKGSHRLCTKCLRTVKKQQSVVPKHEARSVRSPQAAALK